MVSDDSFDKITADLKRSQKDYEDSHDYKVCEMCGGPPNGHHPLDPDPDACLEFVPSLKVKPKHVTAIGNHITHCCSRHGCKYGDDDDCPVYSGKNKQEYPCEECEDEKHTTEDRLAMFIYRLMRDVVPFGELTRIVNDLPPSGTFTAGLVGQWAEQLADRIRGNQ